MGSERQRQDTDISSDICIQSGWTRIHGVQESVESGVVLLPFSLSSLLQVTRFPFCGRRRFSLTIHVLTLVLFIEKSGWLTNFFKRKAKFNRSRTTPWSRVDTDLRKGIVETRIQRARRHDNQVIAKQWRAKGTARSTTQPSTVQANRWAVPPVYGQWRITRVFYSGQQVWTIQASDVACRFGNRSHASFFPMLKISNIFISHIFLSF